MILLKTFPMRNQKLFIFLLLFGISFPVISQQIEKKSEEVTSHYKINYEKNNKQHVNSRLEIHSSSLKDSSLTDTITGNRYFKSGKLKRFVFNYKKILELARIKNDTFAIRKLLFNLALMNYEHSDYSGALKIFNELNKYDIYDRLRLEEILLALSTYKDIGQLDKCFNLYDEFCQYYDPQNYKLQYAQINNQLALIYHQVSPKLHFNTIKSFLNEGKKYHSSIDNNQHLIYSYHVNMGNLFLRNGHYKKAKEEYVKGERNLIKRNYKYNYTQIYSNLGYLELIQHRLDSAEHYLNLALKYIKFRTNKSKAILYQNLGQLYLEKNELTKSYNALKKAKLLILPPNQMGDNISFKNSKFKQILAQILLLKSEFWIKKYNAQPKIEYLDNSISNLHLTDNLFDLLVNVNTEHFSKYIWREKAQELYKTALEICKESNQMEDYFFFIEKSKAMVLQETLIENEAKQLKLIPDSIRMKEKALLFQIRDLENASDENKDSIQHLLFTNKQQLYNVRAQIKQHIPNYLERLKNKTIGLKQLQSQLRSNQGVIEYTVFEDRIFGMFISNNQSIPFELDHITNLKHTVNQFKLKLTQPFPDGFKQTANELYQELIPKSIRPLLNNKSLTIVPDGFLNGLPFEALINDQNQYLLEQHTINYKLSLSFHNTVKPSKSTRSVAFAPNTFNTNSLSALPYTLTEVATIEDIVSNTTVYTENNATKAQFLKELEHNSIIHLATHAKANDSISPWIAFNDDKINLDELYLTKNNADMVVLSACETNNGQLAVGEGVLSLTRGFFQTGAKSVVSSIWSIDDKATAEIMTSFYENLSNKKSKSVALQHAKLDFIKKHPETKMSPYFWASMVLVGNPEAIDIPKSYTLYYIAGALLIALILFVLMFRRKKCNKLFNR